MDKFYWRKYREEHRDHLNELSRKRYQANKEKYRLEQSERYEKTKRKPDNKLTIYYEDSVSIQNALAYVMAVVNMGRVSKDNTCFCYVTTFKDDRVCFADVTRKGNDTFSIKNKE